MYVFSHSKRLVARFLALFLALQLSMPSSAFSMRAEGVDPDTKDAPQGVRAGLEAALRDPNAAIQNAALLLTRAVPANDQPPVNGSSSLAVSPPTVPLAAGPEGDPGEIRILVLAAGAKNRVHLLSDARQAVRSPHNPLARQMDAEQQVIGFIRSSSLLEWLRGNASRPVLVLAGTHGGTFDGLVSKTKKINPQAEVRHTVFNSARMVRKYLSRQSKLSPAAGLEGEFEARVRDTTGGTIRFNRIELRSHEPGTIQLASALGLRKDHTLSLIRPHRDFTSGSQDGYPFIAITDGDVVRLLEAGQWDSSREWDSFVREKERQAGELLQGTLSRLPKVEARDLGVRVEINSPLHISMGDVLRVKIERTASAAGLESQTWTTFAAALDEIMKLVNSDQVTSVSASGGGTRTTLEGGDKRLTREAVSNLLTSANAERGVRLNRTTGGKGIEIITRAAGLEGRSFPPEVVRIAVVEDYGIIGRSLLRVVRRTLQSDARGKSISDEQSQLFSSAAEAIPWIKQNRPQLVITDDDLDDGRKGTEIVTVAHNANPQAAIVWESRHEPSPDTSKLLKSVLPFPYQSSYVEKLVQQFILDRLSPTELEGLAYDGNDWGGVVEALREKGKTHDVASMVTDEQKEGERGIRRHPWFPNVPLCQYL